MSTNFTTVSAILLRFLFSFRKHLSNEVARISAGVLLLLALFNSNGYAQVTAIYSDYGGYWTSSSTSISPILPDNSHNMLAFTWNGTTFSTGVNDAVLTSHSVVFTPLNFRAFPINTVPNTAVGSYFVMLGQLYDGANNAVVNGGPFPPSPSGAQLAAFLTDGTKGLNLGTGLANIPAGSSLKFDLSSNGLSPSAISDGIPDVFITQMASPSSTNLDVLKFVDGSGTTVGNSITIDQSALTPIANWTADFYDLTSTQTSSSFINTSRQMRFYAADLSAFGITASNYHNAVALIYQPGGTSDPAFIAFNEPAISVSTQLTLTTAPATYQSGVALSPVPVVQVRDGLGQIINQAGIPVTVSINSGTAALVGTVTVNTDATGVATFSGLQINGSTTVTLQFNSASLNPAISGSITTTPLPLTWLNFTAEKQGGSVLLKWSTAAEENTSQFVVEQSANGTAWQTIGTLPAAENSASIRQYQFADVNPSAGVNYYRLLEKDLDGSSNYSSIVSIKMNENSDFMLYPNPVHGILNIQLPQTNTVSLYNSGGTLVITKILPAGLQQLDLYGFAKGIYFVKTEHGSAAIVLQ